MYIFAIIDQAGLLLNSLSVQITSREDVSEVLEARFWEVVPGHTVGSLRLQVLASSLLSYQLKHELTIGMEMNGFVVLASALGEEWNR